jgi:prolyl-tRNA editing enzyme YbaK/EbsC (Cys-tRNA(Pro) deacylase)
LSQLERKPARLKVEAALRAAGLEPRIEEFPASTRTASEAASAIGTSQERIVKSLVFMAGDQIVLALVSGRNRVDLERLGQLVGQPIERADARRVREATGFAIGGVPPVGHVRPVPVFIDRDLLAFDQVWAAAGTPNAVFSIEPAALVRVSAGQVVDLKER